MSNCSGLGPGWWKHRIRKKDGTYSYVLLYTHMCGSTSSSPFNRSSIFEKELKQIQDHYSKWYNNTISNTRSFQRLVPLVPLVPKKPACLSNAGAESAENPPT